MNLSNKIRSAEELYRDHLESYFSSVYPADHLFSHGLDHHRRVWEYAKELLMCLKDDRFIFDRTFIQKLIIACYLHDIGMAIDAGEKHGLHSRIMCEKFLEENNMPKADYQDALTAIEQHDNKDYSAHHNDDPLLKILSAADDLDAFGYIGIYRYAEIYLLRGTDPADIGYKVQDNASNRFRYLGEIFSYYPALFRKHQYRFEILAEFFNHYNRSVGGYQFGTGNPSGYCGIIEIIMNNIDNPNKPSLFELHHIYNDKVIEIFFTELMNELI